MAEEIRTLGDGMDHSLSFEQEISKLNLNISIKRSNSILNSLKPIEPQSKVFNLVPKYVPKERKLPKYLIAKPKEPKFIPYEPYKAAVEPIRPIKIIKKLPIDMQVSKNNVEIQELVKQMSDMRTMEMNKVELSDIVENKVISMKQWEQEKQRYETDIKNLRETNAHLENQLKFQAQVNSELKTLLVAAVGEDLESRVQHLTEDKLSLARALLNSANHLTSHQEQTEWLSGQCEVWRSKFLASSLMVEELARWKSALANRVNDLQEVVKQLMSERTRIRKQSLMTYNHLKFILDKTAGLSSHDLKKANILELCNVNQELTENLVNVLKLPKYETNIEENVKQQQYTLAEKNALKILQNPVTITNKPDVLCSAVMGAASSLAGGQRFLQHSSTACCSHCKGEIQNI